jgi:hypothetical protein
MFFSNPALDLKISMGFLSLAFIVGFIIFFLTGKKFLSVLIFSVLGNLGFLVNIGSRMFISYDLKWLQFFSLLIWPIINAYLIFKYLTIKKNIN